MRSILFAILACAVLGADARGNEEDILPVRKVTITADGRKPFGEVSATVATAHDGKAGRVTAITVEVGGKKHEVPHGQLRELNNPRLDTVRFLSGTEKGGEPILYLEFKLQAPGREAGAAPPTVRLAYQGGKWGELFLRDSTK